jgi:hypothetical protein
MLDDLFRPLTIRPTQCRTVLLTDMHAPVNRPGRVFVGPPKPDRWKRTAEQNREKYRRYVERHGRAHINALRARREG